MAADVAIRPMELGDVGPADVLTARTFGHLVRGFGISARPRDAAGARRERGRLAHLVLGGGCVVAEDADGRLLGHALPAVRDGLWVLSLLIVDPTAHAAGVGRRLLDAVLPDAAVPGMIASSPDPRAMRLYASAGFMPRPTLLSRGPIRRVPVRPADVRDGGPADLDLAEVVDRANRGATRRPDLELLLAHGTTMRVVEDRGFAMSTGGRLLTLSAVDVDTARTLLRDHLAAQAEGTEPEVGWITQDSPWAVAELLAAGLGFTSMGALCVRPDPAQPDLPRPTYLASGAYL